MNSTNWKIAEQSKQRIMSALLTTMEHYSYKEITITQIAQEADRSRKTFYRLFPGKEAVMMLIFEKLFDECISTIKEMNIHHYWHVVQVYFNFFESKKELLALFKKNELLPLLFEYTSEHSQEVFQYVRSDEIVRTFSRQLPYLLAYAVGGMNNMMLKWIDDGMCIPSSELIEKLKSGFMSPDI